MKCHICDKTLTQEEIKLTPEYGKGGFAPCFECQSAIDEVFNDKSEEEINQELVVELGLDEIFT
jgi:hypothetical protein